MNPGSGINLRYLPEFCLVWLPCVTPPRLCHHLNDFTTWTVAPPRLWHHLNDFTTWTVAPPRLWHHLNDFTTWTVSPPRLWHHLDSSTTSTFLLSLFLYVYPLPCDVWPSTFVALSWTPLNTVQCLNQFKWLNQYVWQHNHFSQSCISQRSVCTM